MTIGLGLFYTNKSRIKTFETAYKKNTTAFVEDEIARAESTLKGYKNVVFTGIPIIITICALVIVFLDKPLWRASMITTIAMLVVILLIDGTAHGRIEAYYKQLELISKQRGIF